MNRWIVPVAGGGVVVALLGVGVLAATRGGPSPAVAQTPTTVGAPGPVSVASRTITVDGVGVVSGIPDTASLILGVNVQGSSAADAMERLNTKAGALIDTLTAAGVAKADIQTGSISVWPQYRDGSQDVYGYWASNSVNATIHGVDRAGPAIDAATAAVGDGVTLGGISFSIDDTSDLYGQARQKAVDEAKHRASQLAQAAGTSVGTVLSMNESVQSTPYAAYDRGMATATSLAGAAPAPTPIEPGSQELQLWVQVVFELVG